jgi:hypothetical protein
VRQTSAPITTVLRSARVGVGLGALLLGSAAAAEEQRLQAWLQTMAQAKVLGSGWVYVEFQPRVTLLPGDKAGFDQVLLRAAVGWQALRTLSLWVGGAMINQEQRVYEQLQWSDTFGPVKLAVRARLEQRWLPDQPSVKHRARVQFRVAWTFKDPFLLIAYDEPFVNFPFSFDQNRAYLGFGYRPHPQILVELGYLNQYLTTRMGHTALGTVGVGF